MAVDGLSFSNSRLFGPTTRRTRSYSPKKSWCSIRGHHHHQKVLALRKEKSPILEANSIELIYDTLADRLLQTAGKPVANPGNPAPYIVGLAGPPGAGKSTLASEVIYRLNTKASSNKTVDYVVEETSGGVGIAVPMDGFHLYRSQLDVMEDPKEAHARRGAPWTFNPSLLLKCLRTLRSQGMASFPSFDHGVGDPIEDDILVQSHHRVVVVEGNYLLLEDGIWKEVSDVFDEKWFIELDLDTAMQRVLQRHVSTGKNEDVAKWRIEYNDRPNAELIMKSKKNADLIIRSVDVASS